eukprot:1996204-Rhodomonas_salina.1
MVGVWVSGLVQGGVTVTPLWAPFSGLWVLTAKRIVQVSYPGTVGFFVRGFKSTSFYSTFNAG